MTYPLFLREHPAGARWRVGQRADDCNPDHLPALRARKLRYVARLDGGHRNWDLVRCPAGWFYARNLEDELMCRVFPANSLKERP